MRTIFLTRPYRIVPNTAVALPEISPDGLTWTLKVKPGIYFNDDPAFKGQRRELTAADYIYSWKRVLDPKMRSPVLQTFDGIFEGADALVAKARETGKFDYDAPMAGLQALDRYTIRIRLVHPAYDLLPNLTTVQSTAVAREVIEAYGDGSGWAMQNPVGTGPFRLKELAARAEDRARGQSGLSRRAVSGQRRSGGPRDRREDEGQAAAAARRHRHQHRRGIQSAAAGLRERATWTTSRCRRTSCRTC